MSEVKELSDVLKALPSVTDLTGWSVCVRDANGNLGTSTYSVLMDKLAETGKVMEIVTIAKNTPIDADTLYTKSAIYRPASDMSTWDKGVAFDNFPTARPAGGFSLIVLRETTYARQFFCPYASATVYTRYRSYNGSGSHWSGWYKMTPEAVASS